MSERFLVDLPGPNPKARWLVRVLVGIQAFLVLGGWLYRATFYWKLPVAPGQPSGIGDVIELGVGLVLLVTSGIDLFVAMILLVLPDLRRWRWILLLVIAGLAAYPIYVHFDGSMPRLM